MDTVSVEDVGMGAVAEMDAITVDALVVLWRL